MPGEEMEITTDFGHAGFGEDIDIDLDFAVGQPDEDMELADFDQIQDIPNFNSDTRDELMAEGDDASYGMIDVDAEDVNHNEVVAAANDIEIDLGDTDENLWQQNVSREENIEAVVEVEFTETIDASNVNAENVGNDQGSWLESSSYSISKPDEVEAGQVDAINTTDTNLLPDNQIILGDSVVTQDLQVAEVEGTNAEALDVIDNNVEPELEARDAYHEQQGVPADDIPQEPTEESTVNKQHEYTDNSDTHPNGYTSQGNDIHEAQEGESHQANGNGDDVSEIGYDDDDDPLEHEEPPSAPIPSNHEFTIENPAEQEQEEAGQQDPPHVGDPKHQLGSDSHDEPANDHESSNQDPSKEETRDSDADDTQSRLDEHDSEPEGYEVAVRDEKESDASKTFVEHPLSIATRHEMYISYGNTDYRLFAKSEADDPNQYFLSDMAALELPLGQLLSSLRDVISEEVSPLDELVMHVDGLGLEFSESSAADILEEFTFGDILSLYDRLVKNDVADSAPDLYTHLMVRPNCKQRFRALQDSADAGRGLSEIAIYREDTPIDGEKAGDFDGHSPYALLSGEEDEAYDYEESSPAADEADRYDAGEAENNDESNSPLAHGSVVGTTTEDPAGEDDAVDEASEAEEADEFNGAENPEAKKADEAGETGGNPNDNADVNADGTTADGLIDFSDDELDLSSTKQGNSHTSPFNPSLSTRCTGTRTCICDDCFTDEIRKMEASWRHLDSMRAASSDRTVQTEQHFDFQIDQDNMDFQTNSRTTQHFFIPEFRSFKNLQRVTNMKLLQDQQLNGFRHDDTNETVNELNAFATAERNDPDQHPSPTNGTVDAPNSDITSATATLNGDDKDEIDYSDDDGEDVAAGNDVTLNHSINVSATLKVPVDDEITWESEDEDAQDESTAVPKVTVQVSPISGKRNRSDSDLGEGATERNDVKRRRPS
ncbi:uncharacterized protein F4812DRAFT_470889 [Daldinia caldariorum]|uniref:uncharacterized protein n=1 Tax=Daldinia caldariorum TaxID=326644 RepID=UPI00200899F2|nr:uncharacterized protein F4812DRAFT_470889 [Daldinia caldariorum]KAI1468266.1 hypothetical protein F4812DRAFT_470889 [Daldinia caldariorum]